MMKFTWLLFICTASLCVQAQQRRLSGRITDGATGEPLPVVTVSVVFRVPPTNVTNGLGIFTGVHAADTLWLQVR